MGQAVRMSGEDELDFDLFTERALSQLPTEPLFDELIREHPPKPGLRPTWYAVAALGGVGYVVGLVHGLLTGWSGW